MLGHHIKRNKVFSLQHGYIVTIQVDDWEKFEKAVVPGLGLEKLGLEFHDLTLGEICEIISPDEEIIRKLFSEKIISEIT